MAKIALLGAGWLGEPLAHQLKQASHQVWASTTSATKLERLKAAELDARLLEVTPDGMKGDIDAFFAANILVLSMPPGGRRDPAVEKNYPAKMAHIITAAQAGGVKHVLFTSSTGIYGEQDGIITEESTLFPVTNSGKALKIVEQQLKDTYDNQLTILRLAGLYGPGREPGRWLAGKQNIKGGNQYVNLVHQADVLAIMQAVIKQNAWGHTLNVCSDEHPAKEDFYPMAAKRLGLEPPVFLPSTGNTSKGKWIVNEKAKKLLHHEYCYSNPLAFIASRGV